MMQCTPAADSRTRFIFDDMPVRSPHVWLENVWRHVAGQKPYPAAIRHALDELLAAGVLLLSSLKTDGTLTVQVQGQGRLKMLVVKATSEHTARATACWSEQTEISADESLVDLLGDNGIFALTLQPKDGEQWQGIVPLEGGNITHMLMNYMKRSEQLDTHIAPSASDDVCGGLLVRRLPEKGTDGDAWAHVGTLAQTAIAEELVSLDTHHLPYRLPHEIPPRVFEPEQVESFCTCSCGKISDILLMLGAAEVGGVVAEQGSIETDCDFCHVRHVSDETDVNAPFGADIVDTARQRIRRLQ